MMNVNGCVAAFFFCLCLIVLTDKSTEGYGGRKLPRHPICVHYFLQPICILYHNPVCGSNGMTYQNECELCIYCREHHKDIKIVKDEV
ncbi:serine protease inhibitor Kazal-type 4-like [Rhineura floridana]|uniref:serine protease inhibitor Kazal-type 4-like n=1 Tax=Rhineura floridana TaxID=261503 RepID=UPI002AC81EBC|nr:serine protease inhibitor Kazal-type 4-like [Rhineura floridana]